MPRTYKRTSTRASWSVEQLEAAIKAIRSGRRIREVGKAYGIAESTLRDRLRENHLTAPKLGRNPVFTPEQEKELVDHVLKLSNLFYGMAPIDLRRLAFEFAEALNVNLKKNFNTTTKLAGRGWLELFLKRNPKISLRKPEGTSINRIQAFNETEVNLYFTNLEILMEKHGFSENKIFNVDETGISTVQKPGKILATKGQKQVGSLISWERGKNVTVVCAFSATGIFVPPMFIFPRTRMSVLLQKNGPICSIYSCSKNGWINEGLFFQWLQHFKDHVKPTQIDPILLLLDNHASHISLQIFDYCRENGIIMLSIPPHTSHRLQPLDLTFYGPLKTAFNRQCDLFLKSRCHEKISHYELAGIFNKAYLQVATMEKGVSGFSAAGICPLNPEKFSAVDFEPAQQFTAIVLEDIGEEAQPPTQKEANLQTEKPQNNEAQPGMPQSQPGTSKCSSEPQPGTSNYVRVKDISPLPQPAIKAKRASSNRKQHSQILTATPMKNKLDELEKKKKIKAAAEEKKNATKPKQQKKVKNATNPIKKMCKRK